MTVYAYTDHSTAPPEFSFHLERESLPSIEACYVDQNSIECLGNLIEGELSDYRQILDAETYLRALIFHEKIRPISPCVQVTHVSALNTQPFVYSHWKNSYSFRSIDFIFQNIEHNCHICPIDNVVTFANSEIERCIVTKQNERHAQFGHLLKETNVFHVNTNLGRYVPLCQTLDDYADNVFAKNENLVSKFLKEIPEAGMPFYLSDKLYADRIDKIYSLNPLDVVLEKVDYEWGLVKDALKYSVNIPMPPFIYMVLSRAANRREIPEAILKLHKDFEHDRKLIWEFLDEIKYRSGTDPLLARRLLSEIDEKIGKVMSRFCRTGYGKSIFINYIDSFSLIYDLFMGSLPRIGDLSKFTGNLFGAYGYYPLNGFKVQLETIDWYSFEKHFSQQEINALYRSLGRKA